MTRTSPFAVALSALLVLLALPAEAQDITLYTQDFETGIPKEWNLGDGWQVVEADKSLALAGAGHTWAVYPAGRWDNYRLAFRVKLEGYAVVHVNVRCIMPQRYFVGLMANGSYLSKQTGAEAFENNLDTGAGLGRGWHTVEVSADGPTITVTRDGRQLLKYVDPQPLAGGGIAFESLQDGQVLVDDVVVTGKAPALAWIRLGGPPGGLGYDVRMRRDDPERMYVTDAWAGVFGSNDGGRTWRPMNEGITTRTGESGDAIPVFSLTIDSAAPDTIWVGTQFQTGIFKSTDAGRSWRQMNRGIAEQGVSLRGFGVDPRDSRVVYAAGEISSWEWNGSPAPGQEFDRVKGVVYKTVDGGEHWQRVWLGDNLARYVWIDPRDSNVVYVSTGIFDREAANSDPAARTPGGVGVLKSTDGGRTWRPVNNGLGNLYVGTLFMHPKNPDVLLAGAGNIRYSDGGGVYLSTNGGASWTRTLAEPEIIIESVEFSLSNPQIAYAGSAAAVYRSADSGRTWKKVTPADYGWGPRGVLTGFPIDFEVDPRNPDRIFANNYGGGNFLSIDAGRTWSVASAGYTGAQARAVAVDADPAGAVFAACRSGLFSSTDGGATWKGLCEEPATSLEWNAVAVDPGRPGRILAGTNWDGWLFASWDAGVSWQKVARSTQGTGWRCVTFAPSSPLTVYAGTAGFASAGVFDLGMPADGVWLSADGGASWTRSPDPSVKDAAVDDVAVDPRSPRTAFAATYNRGLLKTQDGGRTWTALSVVLRSGAPFSAVEVSPSDGNVVLAGILRGGIVRSEDGGATWRASMVGLAPEANVSDIVFDPTDPRVVYAADLSSGVYRSADAGATWRGVSQGLYNRAVNSLAISRDGRHLYAATEGGGVSRLDLDGRPPGTAGSAP